MPPRYAHIFIEGPTLQRAFSSPRRGGETPRLYARDRIAHSAYIRSQITAAWESALESSAVYVNDRQGVYLEFSSEPGFDLAVKSLESIKSGVRLLNVRKLREGDSEITRATIYVPRSKASWFLNKVDAYAAQDTQPRADGTTSPKHATLINNIGAIKAAIVESFWQDAPAKIPDTNPDWVEAWLNSTDLGIIERFQALCHQAGIELGIGQLTFPERTAILIRVNRAQMAMLIESSDAIAEFRAGKEVASFFVNQTNTEQATRLEELLSRISLPHNDNVAVLVLDHGVNNGHRLLEPLLSDADCHSVDPQWGANDHHGHGTLMAGTAAYGDLLDHMSRNHPLHASHHLESSKILPPPPQVNAKNLWGHFTSQGVSKAEIAAPHRRRVICMAVTSRDDHTHGRPTSWSAKIDDMSSGYSDDVQRLIVLSAGNVDDSDDWRSYPSSNATTPVEDPAQAWNALTVGAYTRKVDIRDPWLRNYTPIANIDQLSPFSTTSLIWQDRKWPIKPEVLLEGGNVAKGPNDSIYETEDLKLLSTFYDPQVAQFAPFHATSAACAQAAWMAARIQSTYPEAWPETVRALIVHSAKWTDAMKRTFLADDSKSAYYRLAKICGYGVPDLESALSCAANSLTLISQSHIQPFEKKDGKCITKDMHLYRLPWPTDVLTELGETPIQMRVTLSYFIEPGPGEIGWKDRYRYPSHGLRFQVNGPSESESEFLRRINRKAREEDERPDTEGSDSHWKIGEARNVGSIHSDIWTGSASQLALSNRIAIYPTVGWWRERHQLGRYDRRTRYSLVVSIISPNQNIDIYTPVVLQLDIPIRVTI